MASPNTKLVSALLPNAVSMLTAPVRGRWFFSGSYWDFSVGFFQDMLCTSKVNTDESNKSANRLVIRKQFY